MATKKSTVVRKVQTGALRLTFQGLERGAPDVGARLAERLWFSVGTPPPRPVRERHGVPDGAAFTVPLSGRQVHGVSFGDPSAPRAYLVHGWGGWWQQLSSFIPLLLDRGYRVVAFDALAHGESGPGSHGRRSSTVPEMADSYRAVVDRVGRPALTVAHSMGCLSVLWAQRHHGLAPARQVLLAPAATTAGMLDVFSRTLTLGPSVRAGLQRRFRARMGQPLSDFDLLPLVTAEQREGSLSPALVVHDSDDEMTSAIESRRLVQEWHGARLRLTRGLGHYRLLRAPEVLSATEQFLGTEVASARG